MSSLTLPPWGEGDKRLGTVVVGRDDYVVSLGLEEPPGSSHKQLAGTASCRAPRNSSLMSSRWGGYMVLHRLQRYVQTATGCVKFCGSSRECMHGLGERQVSHQCTSELPLAWHPGK